MQARGGKLAIKNPRNVTGPLWGQGDVTGYDFGGSEWVVTAG